MRKLFRSNICQPIALCIASFLLVAGAGCAREAAPAATTALETNDPTLIAVPHPELFKLVKVESHSLPSLLDLTGIVSPDVNRLVHVTSSSSGRVVEIKARLGDSVQKGQVLVTLSSAELGSANSDYRKGLADEELARKALDRAHALYDRGALAAKDLEAAQNTDDKAKVEVAAAAERIRLLGGAVDRPGSLIALRASISGTVVEQNIAIAEGIKTLDNTPSLLTLADLSRVWVLCDVFEKDLGAVNVGDVAELHFTAFPEYVARGRVSDISHVLDPNTRSAKARVELDNASGRLRPGMFAAVRFYSTKTVPQVTVPATAVLRLHDKDWVFRQQDATHFRKLEVHSAPAPDNMLQIATGLVSGDTVAADALEFSAAVTEK